MKFSGQFYLAVASFLSIVSSLLYDYSQYNGMTRLIGSSFGPIGVNKTYDYVIVGGGTAGLTLGLRLTQNTSLSVAVIEAGSFYEFNNMNYSQIPAFDGKFETAALSDYQPLIDWGVATVPQSQLNDRVIFYASGKVLGGGSSRNLMIYHRSAQGAYDKWADEVGDQSYSFNNIQPYLEKSCAFTPPNYEKRSAGGSVSYDPEAFTSSGGPLQISYSNFWQPMSTFVRSAFNKLGLKEIKGFNSGKLIGFAEYTLSVDPAASTRSSSETSFLRTALGSTSLIVYQSTLAKQILFDSQKTATGVTVVTGGKTYTISAEKEVILSAGSFRSPQMLMVSGIGPQSELSKFNIPAVSVLEGVGQNLWDQPYFGTSFQVNITTQSQLTANSDFLAQATYRYLRNQTGPMTNGAGNFWGFEKLPKALQSGLSNATLSQLASFPADWPDLELLPIASPLSPAAAGDTNNYASSRVALLTPSSRGSVTLNSTDTADNPLVNPNWLATETDQEIAVQAFKRARQVASALGIMVGEENEPGPSVQTDAEILNYIRSSLASIHHAVATCAMGKAGDPKAVVDSHARVFGVQGLRVVDASAFPFLPPGHAQALVYMLAEKIADDILHGN